MLKSKWMSKMAVTALSVLVLLCGWFDTASADTAAGKPVMRIPKMKTPPKIDGRIDEKEWADASEITGFTSLLKMDQYPADMRGVWYLGYDDTCLYLAMHLPVPKGVTLNAQTKDPMDCDNENAILFGDHVEIQITPHKPQRAMQLGFGFYKFIVNPFDVYSDWWHNCDQPGNESGWASGATIKSSFDLNNWWLEMAIPIVGTMKSPDGGLVKRTDGLELLLQLVNSGSCGGYAFAGWVPASWLEWDRFYKVTLDPQAPVMQFTDTGDLIQGKLDTRIRMRGASGQSAAIAIEVFDVDGKSVFKDKKNLSLNTSDWSVAAFQRAALDVPFYDLKHGAEWNGKRNRVELSVESDGKTVYAASLPFSKHTSARTEATYGEYISSLPKGDYQTRIAYIRRNGKFRVTVDTDVIGNIPQPVRDAKQFRLQILQEGKDKPILDQKMPIVNGVGSHLLELGKLEGVYNVTIDLLDGKGDIVSTRKHRFENRDYAWENNSIGKERAVIPPFRPIEFAGETLKTRLAQFKLGKGGLWDSLQVLDRPILTGPMRMEGSVDGKEIVWNGESVNIERGKGRVFPPEFDKYDFMVRDCPKIPFGNLAETDGYEAIVTGKGTMGPISVSVKSTMDYDGYTRFQIRYEPTAGPVKLDRLEVVLDLFDGVNGMGLAREIIPFSMSLPLDKQGVLWESASFLSKPPIFRGTFVPLLHLGDGKYGLQFRAASDEGWLLDDKVSCMRVERQGKTLRLRLLLVNAPATLGKARTVDFSLMPLPAKPVPGGSRNFVWGGPNRDYVHHAFGWRKYGTGSDNWFLPTDVDYDKLGQLIREHKTDGAAGGVLAEKAPTMMYSSFCAVGSPLPDCDSFKGQWYKNSEYDPGKGCALQYGCKGKSPTGHPYDRPECFSEARPEGWDEDLNDNYLWFHRKLVTLTGTNGTYWDNAEITQYINLDSGSFGYVRDDGHKQPTNDMYQRRSLLKRLYTMGWLEGKPPLYNTKFPWNTPFTTVDYAWEGPWYVYTDDGSFFDGFQDLAGLRFCRDSINTPLTINAGCPAQNRRAFDYAAQRSYFALAVLHDMGLGSVSTKNSVLLRRIDQEIGFLDLQKPAEFIPYWEADKFVRFVEWKSEGVREAWREWSPEGVFVSVFRSQTQPGKTLLWFVNSGDKTAVTGLRLDVKSLTGFDRKDLVLRNLETGDQLSKSLPPAVKDANDRETLWGTMTVPPKDFRAVILEKGEYRAPYNPWP